MREKQAARAWRLLIAVPCMYVGPCLLVWGAGLWPGTQTHRTALIYGFAVWLSGMVVGCVRWGLLLSIGREEKEQQDVHG